MDQTRRNITTSQKHGKFKKDIRVVTEREVGHSTLQKLLLKLA